MRAPLSKARVNKLIYVKGQSFSGYWVVCHGFAGQEDVRYFTYTWAVEEMRMLRDLAYNRPDLFDQMQLSLGEQAKIAHWLQLTTVAKENQSE